MTDDSAVKIKPYVETFYVSFRSYIQDLGRKSSGNWATTCFLHRAEGSRETWTGTTIHNPNDHFSVETGKRVAFRRAVSSYFGCSEDRLAVEHRQDWSRFRQALWEARNPLRGREWSPLAVELSQAVEAETTVD